MGEEAENNRVYWHSRRGMLELDIVLMPFARDVYPTLSTDQQALYRRLLSCEDTELFAWFLGHREPPDRELSSIVEFILSHNKPAQD
jgi:antitoxin CptB